MALMERDEFAEYIGVSYNQYIKWEPNTRYQPSLKNLWNIWKKLKNKFPDINLQDLLEE